VFAVTAEDVSKSDSLIQGECVINGNSLIVLFDSGASHSFISANTGKRLGLQFSTLEYDLTVCTPTAQNALTNTICRKVPFSLQDKNFVHDLICLPLSGIDVILGIDWLSVHHVFLDCFKKTALIMPTDMHMKIMSLMNAI